MKTFIELSEADRRDVINHLHTHILIQIAQRTIVFEDNLNEEGWQEIIDKIIKESKGEKLVSITEKLSDNTDVNRLAYIMAGELAGRSLYVDSVRNIVNLTSVRGRKKCQHSESYFPQVVH